MRDYDLEKLDREALLERVHVERQRATKAEKAKVELSREVSRLGQQLRELSVWKERATKVLCEVRQAAKGIDQAVSNPPTRLLRGRPRKNHDDPSVAASDHVRRDVRLSNFLPDCDECEPEEHGNCGPRPGGDLLRGAS